MLFKKFLIFLFIGLFFFSLPLNAGTVGSGKITLSEQAFHSFLKYIRGDTGGNKSPEVYLVTTDGANSYYWYCEHGACRTGNNTREIKMCEDYFNKPCKVFARKRYVVWSNGINTGGKRGKINSKWTDTKIREKFVSLGFLGQGEIQKNTTTNKITKTDNLNLTENLKKLKELYDDGVLNKEEFEKAKKKILN
jgi:hypothetical protein